MPSVETVPFWKRKTFGEMTPSEWESLCDGCGRCCLLKLQDEDASEILYTAVVCRFLAMHLCRCKVYEQRSQRVPTCVALTPENVAEIKWMPKTCAYRLLAEGKELDRWHPLVSGSPESVHNAGISVRGKVISERGVDMDHLEEFIVDWLD
jgi:uncharacterized cysteine cluster protein YcgN (CxxCxxCC family)